jgi:multiple sugar transport system ATP-binding protein
VGIRPEDIKLGSVGEGIAALVEVTELLGSDLNIYFKIGERTYIMKTEAASGIRIGDTIYPVFDGEKLHLFDKETEVSLIY